MIGAESVVQARTLSTECRLSVYHPPAFAWSLLSLVRRRHTSGCGRWHVRIQAGPVPERCQTHADGPGLTIFLF